MPTEPEEPHQNPIVALAMRIRARQDIETAVDAGTPAAPVAQTMDAGARLAALAEALQVGAKRLNSILGKNGVTIVRLERPLRIRVRFGEKRIALDLDDLHQLVIVRGEGQDGEYQFDTNADVPALINLSILSTDAGYGDALTASSLLKEIARDAELPRPAHLDASGPLTF